MKHGGDIEAKVAEGRALFEGVEDTTRRWNRVEEAIDPVCEETVDLLDKIGRTDDANDINAHMDVVERFELLSRLYREGRADLARDAEAAGFADAFDHCLRLLAAWAAVFEEEKRRKRGD